MSKQQLIYRIGLNILINLFLFSRIKIFLYRILLGYKISYKAELGFFSTIVAKHVKIGENTKIKPFSIIIDVNDVMIGESCSVYRFTYIRGLESFNVGNNSIIGANTTIYGRFYDRKIFSIENGGRFEIGSNSVIGNRHYYDMSGNISIGDNVVIGGTLTQFFTHGYDCYRNFSYGNIIVGNNCYIGTSSIVLAGVTIGSEIIIAAGTIVCKSCKEKGIYGGNPVKKIKDNPKINIKYLKK